MEWIHEIFLLCSYITGKATKTHLISGSLFTGDAARGVSEGEELAELTDIDDATSMEARVRLDRPDNEMGGGGG